MVHNFNAGPSILPKEVFQEASEAVLNFNQSGLSILEIGHRTPAFQDVMEEARALVKELMNLTAGQEVLFLHGGASTQFMQVPMNLLPNDGKAVYLDGGIWGSKAIKEAKNFGEVVLAGSSKEDHYRHIPAPENWFLPEKAHYFHYTTNNTVEGTQMQYVPDVPYPLVADMSSDILSRNMDFNRFGLIYAGAQKNVGAAGVNLLVVKPEILGQANRKIPTILNYQEHIANESMLNTPPVFAVYICMLTLRWLKKKGGVGAIEKENQLKAELLYNTLDDLSIFTPTVRKSDRSWMNVVFVMENQELEKKFLEDCKKEGFYGLKGHRSVGGFRASLYNALPYTSVEELCSFMRHFAQKNG